jgi:methanol--5-hydroxybenzimidazolylcobamide Co-methyltransferase
MRTRVQFPLAIQNPAGLLFGVAPRPLPVGPGLMLGTGTLFPEIRFALPPMAIEAGTWKDVRDRYRRIVGAVIERARALEVPGVMVDFDPPPPLAGKPEWSAEITALFREALDRAREETGLRCGLRVTLPDLRSGSAPLRLRSGPAWDALLESWRRCAAAGADVLGLASAGGREVHDAALEVGDLTGVVFALGVLAARDMEYLWDALVAAAGRAIPGSDSAAGFVRTASRLTREKGLPAVFDAVGRAMGAARSLVAFECGARGPSLGGSPEGPVLKVITGCPIAMTGRGASGGQAAPAGNISAMAADLWCNEAVQDVPLHEGHAPEIFLETLAYDCRLLNAAADLRRASLVRDLLVASDEIRDPRALVLGPAATLLVARVIVQHAGDDYRRTLAAGRAAVGVLEEAVGDGRLRLVANEIRWLDRVSRALNEIPGTADQILADAMPRYAARFEPANYGL